MASLLAQADVVLNSSVSEGGMPNSVLEALALERAVLVSDVPGNRALVEDEVTGLTFADDAELATKANGSLRMPRCERDWAGPAGRSSSVSIRSRGSWMATSARTCASASRSDARERWMQRRGNSRSWAALPVCGAVPAA
jgi:glycosyltransferase involved in cell wall biosynthesis